MIVYYVKKEKKEHIPEYVGSESIFIIVLHL